MRSERTWPWLAVCLLSVGCDIPTTAPIIEQRWILPLEAVSLDQAELLPADVSILGNMYDIDAADVNSTETLGNMCPTCPFGIPAFTPAFNATFVAVDALPNDVLEAEVSSGSIDITITNGLDFDPLAGGSSVSITVAGASGGPVLGSIVFDGAVDALPPSTSITRTLDITGGTVVGALETTTVVTHTGGEPATMDASDQIGVGAVVTSMLLSSVVVDVDGVTASLSEENLDVEDLDEAVLDAIKSGSVVLDVTNPFAVTFSGTFTVGGVTKAVEIPGTPTSTVQIAFTGNELRSFLGQPGVTVAGSGTLGGGPATVTPADELTIDTTIDLTIEIGG